MSLNKNVHTNTSIESLPDDILWLILKNVFQYTWDKEYSENCYYEICGKNCKCANPLNVQYTKIQKTHKENKKDYRELFPHIEGWFSDPYDSKQAIHMSMTTLVGLLGSVSEQFYKTIFSRIDVHIGCWGFRKGVF